MKMEAEHSYIRAVNLGDARIARVIGAIQSGRFSPGQPDLFKSVVQSLIDYNDPYFVLADFGAYLDAQTKAGLTYHDQVVWTEKAILNVARSGKFSSDRAIWDYAREIWECEAGGGRGVGAGAYCISQRIMGPRRNSSRGVKTPRCEFLVQ